MMSTAYSWPSKLPGGGGPRRLPPRLMRSLTTKVEPKKLDVDLIAGCCLALLTYVSLAKLFAIYSLTTNTSTLLQNSSSSSLPKTETIPSQETFSGGKNENSMDRVDPPKEKPVAATKGSEEPGLPEALSRMVDVEKTAATSEPKPSEVGEEKKSNGDAAVDATAAKMTCDENGVDEDFPYARPAVCELSGDIRVSPKQKTMYLVNPPSASGFDERGEKRLRPYARKDDFLPPGVVEVTVKSILSVAVAPQCTKHRLVPAVVFSVAGYTNNFFHDMTGVMIPLFLTTAHLKGEVQLLITNYKPWWVKYTLLLRKLSNYDMINYDEDVGVHCFPQGYH